MTKKINNTNFSDIKLTRKDRVIPLLSVNSKMKIHDDVIPIDPLLLFQRICVSKKFQDELPEFFKFELAPYPLSLFDEAGMRKTQKSTFFVLFSTLSVTFEDLGKYTFVIDGGMLLHRVKWNMEETFDYICKSYVRYLKNHYGNNVIVIFDGYKNAGTKSMERERRALKKFIC